MPNDRTGTVCVEKVGKFLVIVAQCRTDSEILNGCWAGH